MGKRRRFRNRGRRKDLYQRHRVALGAIEELIRDWLGEDPGPSTLPPEGWEDQILDRIRAAEKP